MHYYRIRAGHKSWADRGPDLLRTPANSKQALRSMLRDRSGGFLTRFERTDGQMTEWNRGNRVQVLDRFGVWLRNEGGTFQVAIAGPDADKPELVAAAKHERVPFIDLPHCSRDVSEAWSLVSHHFGKNVVLSGAFFYREVAGLPGYWSDHAWGDALDASPKNMTNDVLFDWMVRMLRERCMYGDNIIGSLKGDVKAADAPGFEVRDSGAAVSHTWHCHLSTTDHDGAKPPRNPMRP